MTTLQRWLVMAVLSFSGGIIFMLPFLQETFYKPLADAMDLNNTQTGMLLSVFGAVSMLTYFPGGWLADRVSSRKLISGSLLLTGIAGFWFAQFPGFAASLIIHAFWGVSITFMFWGAMIRVTRDWAPADQQGRAFGILEGGRGIGELVPAAAMIALFTALGSGDRALSAVVTAYASAYVVLAVLAWLVLDDGGRRGDEEKVGFDDVLQVLRMPVVWLIALVILCGYCAYWGLFRYTPMATDVFALSVTAAAAVGVGKMVFKILAPPVAGLLGDRFGIARAVAICFVLIIVSFVGVALLPPGAGSVALMLLTLVVASIAVFGMRGIYFALLEECRVPLAVTGTAAGVVSAVGFTPDIFMPLLGGVLIDRSPGVTGYRQFFLVTAAICIIGLATVTFLWLRFVRPRSAPHRSSGPGS